MHMFCIVGWSSSSFKIYPSPQVHQSGIIQVDDTHIYKLNIQQHSIYKIRTVNHKQISFPHRDLNPIAPAVRSMHHESQVRYHSAIQSPQFDVSLPEKLLLQLKIVILLVCWRFGSTLRRCHDRSTRPSLSCRYGASPGKADDAVVWRRLSRSSASR